MLCFDAHCHLQDPRFGENQNAAAYASRNLTGLSVCGCHEADWAKVGDLSRAFANITPSFGLHPYFIAERTEKWLDSLESILQRFPNAHIGECGLDKTDKCEAVIAEQLEVFRAHFALAARLGKTLTVHCVRAFPELLNELKRAKAMPKYLVLHSFGGSKEIVKQLLAYPEVMFSVSGAATNPTRTKLLEAIKHIPDDKLLVESDAPDQRPRDTVGPLPSEAGAEGGGGGGNDGTSAQSPSDDSFAAAAAAWRDDEALNHPIHVLTVLKAVADAREQEVQAVAIHTSRNARRVFAPAKQDEAE